MTRPFHIILLLCLSSIVGAQEIYEVVPIDVRPAGEDYAPVFLDSGFVMCSHRDQGGLVNIADARTNKPLANMYWVPLRDGTAGTPALFSAQLASPVNDGPAAFTDNGRTICYTRNQVIPRRMSDLRNATGQLGLYFSQLIDGAWTEPVPFEYNAPGHSIMHPTFSSDGTTLYFASDMPGGSGGSDLYASQRTATGWSEPRNLGSTVNGPGHEIFPTMRHDGVLHFSSNRPGGLGGMDLYRTMRISAGAWSPPVALPAPVNSTGNDTQYTTHPLHGNALFSSDREGRDRIFSAKRTVPRFRDCAEQLRNQRCFALRAKAHPATATLPLQHVWDLGDGTRITGLDADHCFDGPGTYQVRSMLVDIHSGKVFHVLRSHDLIVEDHVQAFIAAPDTVRTGRPVEFDAGLSHVPDMTVAEMHWDLGDGSITKGERFRHQFRTAGTYEVRLDLLGHPDADGTIRNRCNTKRIAVVDRYREKEEGSVVATYADALGNTYLFEYQELPYDDLGLVDIEMSDAKFSVELFASRERVSLDDPRFLEIRALYQVVERFDPVRSVYTYSVGEASDVEELYEIFRKVKELDFLDAEVFALEVEKLMDLSDLSRVSLDVLDRSTLRTSLIHFALGSAELQESSRTVLDQVESILLQHPSLMLVIEAHTDDLGGNAFNLELSQLRAHAVVGHLVQRGIASDRTVPIGHGKNHPIASNRTEAGRSQNRRVEFRMIVQGEEQAYGKGR